MQLTTPLRIQIQDFGWAAVDRISDHARIGTRNQGNAHRRSFEAQRKSTAWCIRHQHGLMDKTFTGRQTITRRPIGVNSPIGITSGIFDGVIFAFVKAGAVQWSWKKSGFRPNRWILKSRHQQGFDG